MAEATKTPARRRRSRHRSAVERVRKTDFQIVLRGYDRAAVDRYVAEIATLVAELEATQLREGVVQRALDEVGEQTSGILQHAHETAEEITARSRSQAEGRIQRAEQEADEIRRDAERYAERVIEDTRRLWQQRQRLIEDMRQLADEVLGVADDALERVEQPDTGFVAAEAVEPGPEQAEPASPQDDPPEPTQVWELPTQDADETGEADPPGEQQPAADDDTTSEFQAPAGRRPGD